METKLRKDQITNEIEAGVNPALTAALNDVTERLDDMMEILENREDIDLTGLQEAIATLKEILG